jgi:hypothetical protein
MAGVLSGCARSAKFNAPPLAGYGVNVLEKCASARESSRASHLAPF